MAGAGYRLFSTGDVLTAAQVNNYLQEQVTMVFANATARTTALSGVLAEGMMSYLQDTNAVQVYNGSAWVNVGEAGDITEVIAGTGLTGGGTTGSVTLSIDSSVVTTTGTTTLTNKTIALGSNTVSGTIAQFNTALTDADFATLAGSETLTNKTFTAPIVNLATSAQTASYTLVLGDASKLVEINNAAGTTLTVPLNSSVAYATGTQIHILQTGAGQITVAGTAGVTVNATPGLKLRAQWSSATLIKRATDTWVLVGDLSA